MTLNSTKPFPVIAAVDTAIDTQAMTQDEMLEYLHKRDISTLKIKAGDRPTVFHLREVSHERQAEILETCTTDAARSIRAFRAAVIEVTDCRFGRERARFTPADPANGLTAEESKQFTMATILDVGAVAWSRSFLGPTNVQRFVPPPLLLAHLAALPFHSAAPSDARQSKSKDSTTQASTGHDATAQDAPSGSPTVAPATAGDSHQAA